MAGSLVIPGPYNGNLSYGDPILCGICIQLLLKAASLETGVVVVIVDVVLMLNVQIVQPGRLVWDTALLECGCCIRSRGFELSEEREKFLLDRFSSDDQMDTMDHQVDPYQRRICLVYIWGLSVDDS